MYRKISNKSIRRPFILAICLWAGFPILVLLLTELRGRFSIAIEDRLSLLLVLYTSFSWSLAVMTFIIETTKQNLLQTTNSWRSALRMGGYGAIAMILALVASPYQWHRPILDAILFTAAAFAYGLVMGYLYQRSLVAEKASLRS